jgi:hypothetical protein
MIPITTPVNSNNNSHYLKLQKFPSWLFEVVKRFFKFLAQFFSPYNLSDSIKQSLQAKPLKSEPSKAKEIVSSQTPFENAEDSPKTETEESSPRDPFLTTLGCSSRSLPLPEDAKKVAPKRRSLSLNDLSSKVTENYDVPAYLTRQHSIPHLRIYYNHSTSNSGLTTDLANEEIKETLNRQPSDESLLWAPSSDPITPRFT